MGLETGTYPSFVGGVSQQDDTVRSPSQLSEAVNAWLHAAMGAGKRPPAVFVQVLGSDVDPLSYFHSILRDEREQYIVAFGHKSVRVFDHVTGKEYTVVPTDDALDYLDTLGTQAWTSLKAVTTADTTFVVNRNVEVKLSSELSGGLVYGSVPTMADLPKGDASNGVPTGAIYHLMGSPESPFDDYYVQKSGANTWTECAAPGIKHRFDRKTMPHVLKRVPDPVHADGFWFSFGAPEWDARGAGDEGSNPEPSFVGQRVREVFLHRNRLGFLSTENVVLSETDAPFNMWRTSVMQMLDSDPIDLAVPTNGVASLNHAVSFQGAIYLSAERGQYMLTAEPYMAAKYAKTDPVNSYSASPYLRPHLLGDSLYFTDDDGTHASLREYFMDDLSITGDAADVTAHVPRYIPGRVRSMSGVSEADCVALAVQEPREGCQLYVYFVRWAGDEKQQSAWCKWAVSGVGRIVHLQSLGESLYVVAEAPGGGVELLRFDLMLNLRDSDATEGYNFLLDRLAVVAPRYVPLGDYTELALPYILDTLDGVEAIATDDWATPGLYLDLRAATLADGGQTIRIPGRHDDGRVAVGLNYEHRMELTRPMIRQRDGSAIIVGRTQVRDLEVAYKDAAYFEVEVQSKGTGRTETYLASHANAFTSRVLDDSAFRTDAPSFHTGSRRFPILSNADNVRITLVNRLPFQCWFQSAQWRGLFISRSRV